MKTLQPEPILTNSTLCVPPGADCCDVLEQATLFLDCAKDICDKNADDAYVIGVSYLIEISQALVSSVLVTMYKQK